MVGLRNKRQGEQKSSVAELGEARGERKKAAGLWRISIKPTPSSSTRCYLQALQKLIDGVHININHCQASGPSCAHEPHTAMTM